jgi:hypothetical protein
MLLAAVVAPSARLAIVRAHVAGVKIAIVFGL